jgi:hypothetical protein
MTQMNDLRIGRCAWDVADKYPARRPNAPHRIGSKRNQKLAGLERTIESAVVPRLIATLKAADPATKPNENNQSQSDKVRIFADLALHHDVREVCDAIEKLRASGFSLENIYVGVLAPTATLLCSLWRTDDCGFAEAALALWRLQEVLREFSMAFRTEFVHREHGLRVLLAPEPGPRQDIAYAMFGLVFVGEFFLREGWDAWIEPDASSEEFAEVIRSQWFDVAEFLVCGDKMPAAKTSDGLKLCAHQIRRHSPNPSIGIMICSQPFIDTPEPIRLAEADLATADTQQESSMAHHFIGSLVGEL